MAYVRISLYRTHTVLALRSCLRKSESCLFLVQYGQNIIVYVMIFPFVGVHLKIFCNTSQVFRYYFSRYFQIHSGAFDPTLGEITYIVY